MKINSVNPIPSPDTAAAARRSDPLTARQADFGAVFARSQRGASLDGRTPSSQEQARVAAQDFVAIALVQPVLKQLRESNTAAPPFAPGTGEKQFRGFLDAQMARDMVRGKNFPLVDRLAHDLLKHGSARGISPREV